MKARLPGLALLLVVLTACGTTVPLTSQASRDGVSSVGSGEQLGVPAGGESTASSPAAQGQTVTPSGAGQPSDAAHVAGVAAPAGGAGEGTSGPAAATVPSAPPTGRSGTRQPGSGGGRKAGSSAGGTPKPGGTAKPGTPTKTGASAGNAPGVSATTVEVGYVYTQNAAAAQAAFGATINYGDPLGSANATVAYINSHGGVAGRQLHLDPYAIDATSTDSNASLEAAACSHFTEDVKVFTVLDADEDGIRTCLDQHGVGAIGSSIDGLGPSDYAGDPTYIDTENIPPEVILPNLVDQLAAQHYFTTKWDTTSQTPDGALPVKIGIVLPDLSQWTDGVKNYLLPALAKQGITVDPSDIYTYTYPDSSAGDGTTVSQIQSAVLQFRSDNVTDVIPVEANAFAFFALGANSQKYYPRYGLSTATEAEIGYTSDVTPAQTLVGAVGMGWSPQVDLPDASAYPSAGLTTCEKLNAAAGEQLSGNVAIADAAIICDEFFMVQYGAARIPAGQPLTLGNFVAGAQSLGTSFPIALTPTALFSPSHRYPVNQAWAWSWDTGCTCMKYTGPAFALR